MKNFLSCLSVQLWLFSMLTGSYELNAVAILLLWFPSMASTMGFPDNIAKFFFLETVLARKEKFTFGGNSIKLAMLSAHSCRKSRLLGKLMQNSILCWNFLTRSGMRDRNWSEIVWLIFFSLTRLLGKVIEHLNQVLLSLYIKPSLLFIILVYNWSD